MKHLILALLLLASCGGAGPYGVVETTSIYAYSTGGSSSAPTQINFTPGPVTALYVDVGPLHRDSPAGPLTHYLGDLPAGTYTATVTYTDHADSQTFTIYGEAWYLVVAP